MLVRAAIVGMLIVAAGCRSIPGRVACYDCPSDAPKREVVFARHVAKDTLHNLGHEPFESASCVVTGTARFVRSVNQHILGKTIRMRFTGNPPEVHACARGLDPDKLECELHKLTGSELQSALVEMQIDHAEAMAALESVIDGANHRLDIVMFQWDNDDIGWHVAHKVAAKAGTGVPVRILIDGAGNLLYGRPKDDSPANLNAVVCWLGKQSNVEMIRSTLPMGRLDHRKIVMADSRIAWTGGRNFTEDEFTTRHDLSLVVRGAVVKQFVAAFDNSWMEQGGKDSRDAVTDEPVEPVEPNASARLVTTADGPPTFERALTKAIDSACHHIYLENPYLSDGPMIAKLAAARQRGVDVRMVMTIQTGQTAFDRGNRATANRLLKAGIRVYIYPGFTHMKAASVDGAWAYVGSGNFDPHSLRINRECGLAIGRGPFLKEIEERIFLTDFRPEWELTKPFELNRCDYLYELLVNLIL